MRVASVVCSLVLLAVVSGCGPGQRPHLTGKLEGGTFWTSPLTAQSNEGRQYEAGSRVEVYDQFVVVTTKDGVSHVHPHGCYSHLAFKKD